MRLCNLKQALYEADYEKMWPLTLPETGASESQISNLENVLEYKLDESYRFFLRSANGWNCFFHDIDLFGTVALSGDNPFPRALQLLKSLDSDILLKGGLKKSELLPIAVSKHDIDLVVSVKTPKNNGMVIWFAGGEIERFSNFEQFFLALMELTSEEIKECKNMKSS
jgi:hypothetical protein